MATDSETIASLIDAVEHIQDQLADLPPSKEKRPRLFFSLSNRTADDPSIVAQEILRRLAVTAGINDDSLEVSKLSRQLLAWWSDKKAPPVARTFPKEFRAHVRALIREATQACVQSSRTVEGQEPSRNSGTHHGKLISRKNGILVPNDISIRAAVKQGYEALGYSQSSLTSGSPDIKKVVDVIEQVMQDIKDEAVKLFNIYRGVPITDCAIAATEEVIGIFPSSSQVNVVRAIGERLRRKYSAEFENGKFIPPFTAVLSQAIDSPISPQTNRRIQQPPR